MLISTFNLIHLFSNLNKNVLNKNDQWANNQGVSKVNILIKYSSNELRNQSLTEFSNKLYINLNHLKIFIEFN